MAHCLQQAYGHCGGEDVMTLKEAQTLTNPFVRCRDGRIGQIVRMRAGYAPDNPAQDAVGVQVRGERELRWIPVQDLIQGRDGICQEMG
jgi:hypothetical protein